jgi:hypothetical protein
MPSPFSLWRNPPGASRALFGSASSGHCYSFVVVDPAAFGTPQLDSCAAPNRSRNFQLFPASAARVGASADANPRVALA